MYFYLCVCECANRNSVKPLKFLILVFRVCMYQICIKTEIISITFRLQLKIYFIISNVSQQLEHIMSIAVSLSYTSYVHNSM